MREEKAQRKIHSKDWTSNITRPKLWFITKYTYTTEEMPISISATLSYASMVMLN